MPLEGELSGITIQEIKCFVDYNPVRNATEVFIVGIGANGQRWVAEPVVLVFSPMEIGKTIDPTLRFEHHHAKQFLQSLADGLAETGFRPDVTKAMVSELEATRYHLEDMRNLVFKEKK